MVNVVCLLAFITMFTFKPLLSVFSLPFLMQSLPQYLHFNSETLTWSLALSCFSGFKRRFFGFVECWFIYYFFGKLGQALVLLSQNSIYSLKSDFGTLPCRCLHHYPQYKHLDYIAHRSRYWISIQKLRRSRFETRHYKALNASS